MVRTRSHPLVLLLVAVALCAALVAPSNARAATTLGCADDASGVTDLASWIPSMLDATNAHRRGMGLVELQVDPTLAKAATWKSRDLARRDYFAHDDEAGSNGEPSRTPWERLTDCGFTAGGSKAENIAAGQQSGAAFIDAWLNSPGHRANIENADMRYVGFGVASSTTSTYGTYAVQIFSSLPGPAASTPPPATPTPPTTTEPGTTTPGTTTPGTTTPGTTTPEPSDPIDSTPPRTPRGTTVPTRIRSLRATLVRVRCRSRLAIHGWCTVLAIAGRVDADPAARRTVTLSRSTSRGRILRLATRTTSATGAFALRIVIRPAGGVASVLARVAATSSSTAAGASVRPRVRV
jgi:uncharacterized protein YkwD